MKKFNFLDHVFELSINLPWYYVSSQTKIGPDRFSKVYIYIDVLIILGVPMEVMGLMLGEFVDEYTVRVIDVFAMPQSGLFIYYS